MVLIPYSQHGQTKKKKSTTIAYYTLTTTKEKTKYDTILLRASLSRKNKTGEKGSDSVSVGAGEGAYTFGSFVSWELRAGWVFGTFGRILGQPVVSQHPAF